jgi:hypothetical protein
VEARLFSYSQAKGSRKMLKSMAAVSLAWVILVVAAYAQQPPTQTVQVRAGLLLKLATSQALDASTAKRGDDVPLVLTRPFEVDGVILLAAGEILHGTVISATKAGPHCKSGEIKWKVDQIAFHDGTVAKTTIRVKTARANASVPYETVKRPVPAADRAGEVIEAAIISPVIAGIVIAAAVKAPFRRHACSQYTTDLPLPANSTIALEITETHAVRY